MRVLSQARPGDARLLEPIVKNWTDRHGLLEAVEGAEGATPEGRLLLQGLRREPGHP